MTLRRALIRVSGHNILRSTGREARSLSRKTRQSANSLPTNRVPRSAVHHRRRRGLRNFRKNPSPQCSSRKAFSFPAFTIRRNWAIHWPDLVPIAAMLLLGLSFSLAVAGIFLNLPDQFDSPVAPLVRAVHLLPLAVIALVALGVFGPSIPPFPPDWRLRGASSTTMGLAALITGICMALLPFIVSCTIALSRWAQDRFVLSNLPLRFWQFVLLLLVCAGPLLGLSVVARLMWSSFYQPREGQPLTARRPFSMLMAAVFAGTVVGTLMAVIAASRPAALLPAASLPMFLLALTTGKMAEACAPPAISNVA